MSSDRDLDPAQDLSAGGRLSGQRVLALASFDSFLVSAARLGTRLQKQGAAVDYGWVYRRNRELSPAQCREAGLEGRPMETATAEDFARKAGRTHDVVILALDGQRSRNFLAALRDVPVADRPLTVSLFPGLLIRQQLESFSSRMDSDLVLLNSEADLELYQRFAKAMGVPNNAALFGLSALPPRDTLQPWRRGTTLLYVDQPVVPKGRHERCYILQRLVRLAREFPEARVEVKLRHRRGETTLHPTEHALDDLVQEVCPDGGLPKNLRFIHGSMRDALERVDVLLTISSTAALEAMAQGIPTRILTDLGIHEQLGNHFFLDSGALATFDEIRPGLPATVRPEWLAENLTWVEDQEHAVVAALSARLHERRCQSSRAMGRSLHASSYLALKFGNDGLTSYGPLPVDTQSSLTRLKHRVRGLLPLRAAINGRLQRRPR